MAGTNPARDDRPFGMFERSTSPLATDPASRSWQTTQSHQAKPAAPGIAKRHRPDGPRPGPCCPEQTPVALGCPKTQLTLKGNGVAAWQTHKSRHRSPAFRPLRTHQQPAGNRSPPGHPGNPARRSPADPIRAQFGSADSRHCHTSPTGGLD
jgi:hypothetical protein